MDWSNLSLSEGLLSTIPHSRWPGMSSRKSKMMIELNYATDGLRTGNRLKSGVRIGSQVSKKRQGFPVHTLGVTIPKNWIVGRIKAE